MDKKEIIKALKIIKNECRYRTVCDDCPFRDTNGRCNIQNHLPASWDINEDFDVWRALK